MEYRRDCHVDFYGVCGRNGPILFFQAELAGRGAEGGLDNFMDKPVFACYLLFDNLPQNIRPVNCSRKSCIYSHEQHDFFYFIFGYSDIQCSVNMEF